MMNSNGWRHDTWSLWSWGWKWRLTLVMVNSTNIQESVCFPNCVEDNAPQTFAAFLETCLNISENKQDTIACFSWLGSEWLTCLGISEHITKGL